MRGTRSKWLRKLSYAYGNSDKTRHQSYRSLKKLWPHMKNVFKLRFEEAKRLGYLKEN